MAKSIKEEYLHTDSGVGGQYKTWFLDYASYVILERAVPAVEDGLKPVQRRILHAMREMDDGRYNKVANIIGQAMQYHPHGDASIGDALVNMGQKDLLIDTQGNWGDPRTGDDAAAARYIEARLSKFALEVAFNAKTTEWQLSYDGRKNEPVTLPMKFPLLLAHGADGIAAGISPDITIDALYKFTDCEISISPNACVIVESKPQFLTVNDLLKLSVDRTKDLLEQELKIKLNELQDKWHYTSLERIFFEEKIYKELEKKHENWEKVLEAIAKAFAPFRKQLKRDIKREDIIKLTEKPVRRIYKLDIEELDAQIKGLEADIKQVKYDLNNLVDFAVAYYENLLKKYGQGRERKTEIKQFEVIEAKNVAIANTRLYINREEGFIGTGLKKDEFLFECSNLDDIIVFAKRGIMKVVKVADKVFIGKDIIHAAVFQKNDERTTYNCLV